MAPKTPDLPSLMPNDPMPASPEDMKKPSNEKSESNPEPAAGATAAPAIPLATPAEAPIECVPLAERVDPADAIPWDVPLLPVFEEGDAPPAPPSPLAATCPACQAPRGQQDYCEQCGFIFAFCDETPALPAEPDLPTGYLQGRYELGQLLSQRAGVFRYRGLDHGDGTGSPVPVVFLRAKMPPSPPSSPEATEVPAAVPLTEDEMITPVLELGPDTTEPTTANLVNPATWPSIAWEEVLLETTADALLPRVRDGFIEDDWEYLVEEWPSGRPLWDAWDDPEATAAQRFGWLQQLADGLNRLHRAGVILESLRPEMVVITPEGEPRLTDLSELLPWPLPPDAPLRPTLSTAPELVVSPDTADARADLYAFGALLYALHVGRELTETDFEGPGFPRPFLAQFPDAHPALGRLLAKTFCRAVEARFPTDEAFREDPTGFTDLVRMLDVCSRTLDQVRLEVGAWTTTGMARTGNEDAFALLHAVEAGQDDLGESALVLLADGMGGYEAGEVAATLAIQVMRRYLLGQPLFAALAGAPVHAGASFDLALCQYLLGRALKEANREVFQAARREWGRHGMGCTAEAVYINGRHIVVGHVGDSRTYHLHQGRLVQLTRDQTLVNRLVELGTLTPAEAEKHPRRSELQQAIGGHAEVDPALYHGILKPGDWVVVCSDGLSNHVTPLELQQMLQAEAASAEMAARRLVNLANIKGALDNATVVVVRAL